MKLQSVFLAVQYVYSQRDQVESAGTGPDGAVLAFDRVTDHHYDTVARRAAVLQVGHARVRRDPPPARRRAGVGRYTAGIGSYDRLRQV